PLIAARHFPGKKSEATQRVSVDLLPVQRSFPVRSEDHIEGAIGADVSEVAGASKDRRAQLLKHLLHVRSSVGSTPEVDDICSHLSPDEANATINPHAEVQGT